MSHASPKRSRQEPGHQVVHHPRNHKRILEDNEDSVVARMPKKGMNVNASSARVEIIEPLNKFARLPYILACEELGYLYASEFKIHKLTYGMIDEGTDVTTFENIVQVITAAFGASVTVEIPPLPEAAHYQVGWINVVTDPEFIYKYDEDGICSIEYPELVSGKYTMLNDGDGTMFPWIGNDGRLEDIQGPTLEPTFTHINLHIEPGVQIPWNIPRTKSDNLTYVYRKQRFYTFIAIKDVITNICQIIETLTWVAEFAMDIDPEKPLEDRPTLLVPRFVEEIARIGPLSLIPLLDDKALNPPMAMARAVRIYYPRNGRSEAHASYIVPQETIYKPIASLYEIAEVSRMKYF